jgi:glycosyltransferase involved in cell wall biosynthesis
VRVLHVIPSVSPIYGGPSAAIRNETSALAAQGVEVDVATTTANGRSELNVPLGVPVWEGGVRHLFFRRQEPRGWMFSLPLTRWLHAHAADYDLLHVHYIFTYPTLAACWAARRAGRAYVLKTCGNLQPWGLARKSWKKRPYYALLERRNLAAAAALHATSALEARCLSRRGFAAKAHVIHPLAVAPRPAPSRRREPGAPLRLLMLSRLHPVKAIPVLLRALALLRRQDLRPLLNIAGQGEAAYVVQLRRQVAELGLPGQVRFSGFVQGEAKHEAVAEADVFVLPSYSENFGLGAAEAMAAGLPVIVSDGVGLAELVRRAGAGVVVPAGAPGPLARAIRQLSEPAFRERAGCAALELAAREFSHERLGRQLVALYEGLLRRPCG